MHQASRKPANGELDHPEKQKPRSAVLLTTGQGSLPDYSCLGRLLVPRRLTEALNLVLQFQLFLLEASDL